MTKRSLVIAAIGAALVMGSAGCGGGGGSSSPSGGSPTGGGALSASMTLLGGVLASTAAAGTTTNVQLADVNSNIHTINSVYSPDNLNTQNDQAIYWTVIRAGSSLLSGHYTSTTAKYVNATENFSSTIPLTASGTIAKDTIVPDFQGAIVLPIDKVGNYSFPNGVSVTFSSGSNHFSVQNNTLSFTANIPPTGKNVSDAGQMSFTDTGTVSPFANMTLTCTSADDQSGFNFSPATNTTSPVDLIGEAVGSSTVMTNASALYVIQE